MIRMIRLWNPIYHYLTYDFSFQSREMFIFFRVWNETKLEHFKTKRKRKNNEKGKVPYDVGRLLEYPTVCMCVWVYVFKYVYKC